MIGTQAVRRPPEADDGFTLVEILIAIVLVGILSAVVVVGIGTLTSKGSTGACQASMDAARTGAVLFQQSTGSYPQSMAEMTATNPPTLTLSSGVTLNAAQVGSHAQGTIATGSGWSLTMTPDPSGGAPTFACS